jgi:hypothetical protein
MSAYRLIALVLAATPAFALAAPAPTLVIDNDEVAVTDVVLRKGQAAPATPADRDVVILFLEGGKVRTAAGGKTDVRDRQFGDAVFVPRGSGAVDTAVGDTPVHEVVVALKDPAPAPVPNRTGLPLGFPRPGAEKRLETPRVVVWRYSWTAGAPTAMHFHDKDVVIAYRYDGTIRSIAPDGKATETAHKAGDINFNKADRTHSELLTAGRESAVMLELKPAS